MVTMLPGRWGPHSGHGVRASIRPPPRGGVPPAGRRLQECTFGVDGKGGGGSTAGGRRGMLPHGSSAKSLSFCYRNRVVLGCDGRPQYSPRRSPCCLSFSSHGHPIHGRATPLSEGGVSCRPPCALHSWNSRGASTITPAGSSFCTFSQFLQLRENRANTPVFLHPSHHEHFPSLPPADWCSPLASLSRFRNSPPPPPDGVTSPPCVSPGARWRCGSRGRFSRRGCSRTTRSSRCRRVPSRDCQAATP